MKFQVLLLAFAVVIVTNIHCQEIHTGLEQLEGEEMMTEFLAQPQLEDSDKSPVDKGHVMSKRQIRTCNCRGRWNALEQNCPCELQRQYRLSKEQIAFCQKKGLGTYKKCQQLTGGNRKEKKGNKGFSMPI